MAKMKTGEKLTLIDIFTEKKFSVQIPIIQRDYAQGRENKQNIRNEFLSVLFNALKDNKTIDLDFVYGYISNSKFIPLDGQQRLTTLFLLHYYLAIRDERFGSFAEIFQKENYSRFSYETRHSSRSFFNSLVEHGNIILLENVSISQILKDQKWYFYEWENDATVSGALRMLDAIESKFKDSSGFYEKLINERLINFEFLNLEEYNLSDDLYIKMNARGKSLTTFENFKARFEGIIERVDVDLKIQFVNSIDTEWCDLFWNLSKEYSPAKPAVDQLFLNYFSFITELLFHKNDEKSSHLVYDFKDFEIINMVYSSKENLQFLINSLNLFSGFKEKGINTFFRALFSNQMEIERINIFEEETNLFTKILFNFSSITHLDRFLLYSIIEYHLRFNHKELTVSKEITELVRLVRNFVVDINQKGNDNSRDDVVANIRFSNYPEIADFIDKIISLKPFDEFEFNISGSNYRKDFIQREISKVNYINANPQYRESIYLLENHPNLKGNLSSLDLIFKSDLNINDFADNYVYIWEKLDTKTIIRCLLTYGDYSVNVGKCYFGDLRYFGNTNKWERIFNYSNPNLPSILLNLFTEVEKNKQENIESIIKKLIGNNKIDEEWIDLFVKYPDTIISETNIYSFRNDRYYKIDALNKYTLRGYHVNIFINAVLESKELLCKNRLKNNGWAIDTNESLIQLKHAAYMMPSHNGWYISHITKDIVGSLEGLKYKELENKAILLTPSNEKNMVEIAIEFLNKYYK